MSIKLFNTLTRKRETFKPLKKEVGIYTCGPTVYNFAHIGNLRSYIFSDVLKRVLKLNGFKLKHVMNITDVGHLTSDSDAGEDKMLKGAKREKKTVWEVAKFYTKAFQSDMKKLNILSPDIWCKATDHIKEQIELIKKLEKKGFTYQAGGNVYFDTSKLKDYGKLANLNLETEGKARVKKDPHKKNSHDFVLWFTKSKFKDQEMKWKSKFGVGYPGWHVECSAMSIKYLGEQFDIHCGGIDHIPIHHTNEIAQSESATGKKPWVKYWLHNEFLILEGKKMAKSGESFITLSTLEEKGFDPLDFRYFCLGTVYRKPLTFSWDALESAQKSIRKINNFIRMVWIFDVTRKKSNLNSDPKIKKLIEKTNKEFIKDVNDDLNTPKALATMHEFIKEINKKMSPNGISKIDAKEILNLMKKIDSVLGIMDFKKDKKDKITPTVKILARQRLTARNQKDWQKADQLRDKINKLGFTIDDTADGYKIKKL